MLKGGMKAVLWTDTFQLLIIFAGVITVFTAGIIQEGGFGNITEVNRLSGRLDVFEYVGFAINMLITLSLVSCIFTKTEQTIARSTFNIFISFKSMYVRS